MGSPFSCLVKKLLSKYITGDKNAVTITLTRRWRLCLRYYENGFYEFSMTKEVDLAQNQYPRKYHMTSKFFSF